jgi:hypothetical protein
LNFAFPLAPSRPVSAVSAAQPGKGWVNARKTQSAAAATQAFADHLTPGECSMSLRLVTHRFSYPDGERAPVPQVAQNLCGLSR